LDGEGVVTGGMEIFCEEGHGEVARFLDRSIKAWSDGVTGPARRQWYSYAARDDQGSVRGGVACYIYRDVLLIDTLWVDDGLRGLRLGTRLMDMAEHRGRNEGCAFAFLDTMNWQARPFYEKRGYSVFHEFSIEGGKYTRFYMRKEF
jgi:ribosomal protein S18 acetylase RimI-like enzyme